MMMCHKSNYRIYIYIYDDVNKSLKIYIYMMRVNEIVIIIYIV